MTMTSKFTTPAFIRRNDPELRKKLEKLGYKKDQFFDEEDDWLICNSVDQYGSVISGVYDGFGEYYIDYDESLEDYGIDCGENENLFLALAALREDNDYMQWFTTHDFSEWVLSDTEISFVKIDSTRLWHKATSTELIEHFKEK